MKPTGQRWHLRNQHELQGFVEHVQELWKVGNFPTVQFMKGERTLSQNAMIYGLYHEIAKATDQSVLEVKRDCKLRYGVPILRAVDPEFCKLYDLAVKENLSFGEKLVLMDYLPVTSDFTSEQATQYIDTMISEYGNRGIAIRNPRND